MDFNSDDEETRPPLFDPIDFNFWMYEMKFFLELEDATLLQIIEKGPLEITKVDENGATVEKTRDEWDDDDYNKRRKNARALHIIYCALPIDEYYKVSTCKTAKEVWDTLKAGYQLSKPARLDSLTRQYELFAMEENECLDDMFSRFMSIVRELAVLGDEIAVPKLNRKLLSIAFPKYRERVMGIRECSDLNSLPVYELFRRLSHP